MDSAGPHPTDSKPVPEPVTGPILRSTSRGALFLETENARRMMLKLRDLKESVEGEAQTAPEAASAGQ